MRVMLMMSLVVSLGASTPGWAQDIFALIVTRTTAGDMKPEVSVRSLYVVPVMPHQTPQQACDYTQHYVEIAMTQRYEAERWNGQMDYHCVRIPQVRMELDGPP